MRTIAQIAKQLGRPLRELKTTFAYYRQLRLIPPPERRVAGPEHGSRTYYPDSVAATIRRIWELQAQGLTLAEIQPKVNPPPTPEEKIRAVYEQTYPDLAARKLPFDDLAREAQARAVGPLTYEDLRPALEVTAPDPWSALPELRDLLAAFASRRSLGDVYPTTINIRRLADGSYRLSIASFQPTVTSKEPTGRPSGKVKQR